MSAHRFLSNDVNPPDDGRESDISVTCFQCGVTLDATESTESDALYFLPPCHPPTADGRAHHYLYMGRADRMDAAFLDCAYGDSVIRADDVPTVSACRGA